MSRYANYRNANFRYVDGVHYANRNYTDKVIDTESGRLGFMKVSQRGEHDETGDNHVEIIWEDKDDLVVYPLKTFMKDVRDRRFVEA